MVGEVKRMKRGVHTFSGREGPAASALALVLDLGDSVVISPALTS